MLITNAKFLVTSNSNLANDLFYSVPSEVLACGEAVLFGNCHLFQVLVSKMSPWHPEMFPFIVVI